MLQETKFGKFFVDSEQQLTDFILTSTKSQLMKLLHSEVNSRLEKLSNEYSERETETWSVQLKEAEDYSKDSSSSTPFISAALSGAETVQDYVNIILANNLAWSQYAGDVIRFRREMEGQIKSANSLEDLAPVMQELNYEQEP